jgi:hypothetical protein
MTAINTAANAIHAIRGFVETLMATSFLRHLRPYAPTRHVVLVTGDANDRNMKGGGGEVLQNSSNFSGIRTNRQDSSLRSQIPSGIQTIHRRGDPPPRLARASIRSMTMCGSTSLSFRISAARTLRHSGVLAGSWLTASGFGAPQGQSRGQ